MPECVCGWGSASDPAGGAGSALQTPEETEVWKWKRKKREKESEGKGKRWVRRESRACAVLKILMKSSADKYCSRLS